MVHDDALASTPRPGRRPTPPGVVALRGLGEERQEEQGKGKSRWKGWRQYTKAAQPPAQPPSNHGHRAAGVEHQLRPEEQAVGAEGEGLPAQPVLKPVPGLPGGERPAMAARQVEQDESAQESLPWGRVCRAVGRLEFRGELQGVARQTQRRERLSGLHQEGDGRGGGL